MDQMLVGDLENEAIPDPPLLAPSSESTVVRNKVVRIPIVMPKFQSFDDEIESPIFKNKRRQARHNAEGPLKELPLTEVA
jgi:hypothetical protein